MSEALREARNKLAAKFGLPNGDSGLYKYRIICTDGFEADRMAISLDAAELLVEAALSVQVPANEVVCAARHSNTDPPQDCDWPFCGCDPKADKVIETIEESGFKIVKAESRTGGGGSERT